MNKMPNPGLLTDHNIVINDRCGMDEWHFVYQKALSMQIYFSGLRNNGSRCGFNLRDRKLL